MELVLLCSVDRVGLGWVFLEKDLFSSGGIQTSVSASLSTYSVLLAKGGRNNGSPLLSPQGTLWMSISLMTCNILKHKTLLA